MSSLVSAFVVLSLSFLLFKLFKSGRREKFLPPGPPTYPILGNLPSLPPQDFQYKLSSQFTEWAHHYGDIYSLKLGSTTTIVLTSTETVQQIIDKNSSFTADRPPNHIANTVTGEHQPYVLLTRYSDVWRSQRRAMHEILRMQESMKYVPIQKAEIYQFSVELMTNLENFMRLVHQMTFSSIMTVVYGLRIPNPSSPLYSQFEHNGHSFLSLLRPGSQLPVDMFPVLKYLPESFSPWKKIARNVGRTQRNFSYGLLEMVEKRMLRDEGNECFMEELIEKGVLWDLTGTSLSKCYLCQTLLDGSSDTTSSFMGTFILLMTAHPEVVQKVQEEIDVVIGTDRVPDLKDINDLPYLVAAILEAIRFRPVNPIGIPHYTTGPIQHNNYLIPEQSTLIPNIWGIFHDEKIFPDAEKYNPDRLLDNPEAARIIEYSFCAGKRICPGMHYAKNSVHLTLMTLLWGFDIRKARDTAGNEIEVDLNAFDERVAVEPKPFKCDIKPRSARHAEMLFAEFNNSQRDLCAFEVDMREEDGEYLKSLPKEYL